MRKIVYLLLFFILFASCTLVQKSDLADADLFSINSEPTLADEFLYVYEKNNFNNDSIYTESDVNEYFDLFINFKLKVAGAKAEGIDTTGAFLSEFKTYKDQLIKPYLSEAKEQERLVREVYERMKYEIDASHVLISVTQDASPEDTIKAYQKILEVYERAKSGEDFGNLAAQYSEDPSAKSNKGRLGYFSAFQMVFPFEDAAYNTDVDSISYILRSQFGFHVMKIHDKRPFSGKVKVSHIMLSLTRSQVDTVALRNQIFEIHEQIVGGADWNELCQRYSNDQRTKNSGGTLPFIGLRQINDDAFESVAFNLEKPGEISDPVKSRYGWHIIKLEEKQGLEPFDEIREDLEQRVSKDERSRLSRKTVISNLKVQHNLKEFSPVREQILALTDSSLLSDKWDISLNDSLLRDSIFSIDDNLYYVQSVIEDAQYKQKRRTGISPESYMNELIDNFIAQCLLDYEEKQLIETNRDFRMLINEYYEGILLFEIMNQKVWGKASEDTLGLQSYFDDHHQSYFWGERADATILSSTDKETIEEVKKNMDSEQFLLFELELDQSQEVEVLKNESLDSLLNLFQKYDNSSIIIRADSLSLKSELYEKINQYFHDLGISDESIIVQNEEVHKNKILLTLNSKSKKSLEYLYNKESALNLQVSEGLFERGDNQLVDSVQWEKDTFEFNSDNTYNIIVIDEILEKQPKKLKDVKGLVISDYQNYLEKNWIEELRNKNSIEINEITLDKIKRAYRKKLNTPG